MQSLASWPILLQEGTPNVAGRNERMQHASVKCSLLPLFPQQNTRLSALGLLGASRNDRPRVVQPGLGGWHPRRIIILVGSRGGPAEHRGLRCGGSRVAVEHLRASGHGDSRVCGFESSCVGLDLEGFGAWRAAYQLRRKHGGDVDGIVLVKFPLEVVLLV